MKEHLRTAIWRDIIISLRKRRFNSADGDKEEKNMTVKECYEQMGADYEGVLGRLICAVTQIVNRIQKRTVKVKNKCFITHKIPLFYAVFYNII